MGAKNAGVVTVQFNAGTGNFIRDISVMNAGMKSFGSGTEQLGRKIREIGGVSEMRATAAAFKTVEGHITNNALAADKFAEEILGLGPILQAAFPLFGGIAFGGMLFELGKHVFEFYEELRDGPEKMEGAWRKLSSGITTSGDETTVSIDKLNNEIAKLEGGRQNTLKLMLDEAKVSADKLAASLDKTFADFSKFLEENKPGFFEQFFGAASTHELRMAMGGHTGTAGIQADLDKAGKPGELQIAQAQNAAELIAAEKARDDAQNKVLEDALAERQKILDKYERLEKPLTPADTLTQPTVPTAGIFGDIGAFNKRRQEMIAQGAPGAGNKDAETEIAQTKMAIQLINDKKKAIADDAALRTATRRKEADQAANENAQLARPFEDRINKLKSDLSAITLKLNAVGLTGAEKQIATASGEAIKSLEEINKLREKSHQAPLTDASEEAAQLKAYHLRITQAQAEEVWRAKLAETYLALKDQARGHDLLTAAVGRGYIAVRNANVEMQLMTKVGAEAYNDPTKRFAVNVEREQLRGVYDKERAAKTAEAVDKLGDQIELEKSLAVAQTQGAEAVRLTTLAFKLREIATNGARTATGELTDEVKKQMAAELELYKLQRGAASAEQLRTINERIDGIKRLTAAELEGAEAVRKAALENKIDALKREGASPEVIAAARREDEADHHRDITAKVGDRLNVFKDELNILDQEAAALEAVKITEDNRQDVARATLELENKRLATMLDQFVAMRNLRDANLKLLSDISLQMGGAKDGVRSFFLEMQMQAEMSSVIVKRALDSALDSVADNLAKSLTGQKTNWKGAFQGIAQEALKSSIKADLQGTLGKLGERFGITGLGGKPDGTKGNPLWVRMDGTGPGGLPLPGTPGASGIPGIGSLGTIFGGSKGGFIFNFLKGFAGFGGGGGGGGEDVSSTLSFPGRAAGGDISAGNAYMVGERGPELFRSATAGMISSNEETRRMIGTGGDSHYYTIDARGTDPYLTGQRVEAAIRAAHDGAVGMSIQAGHDRTRRTPASRA